MSTAKPITAIVLAAGQGTRMRSPLPKVLHPIAGRTLVEWAVQAAIDAGADRVVVITGHDRNRVEAVLAAAFGTRVEFAHQPEQRGTGDAVRCALPLLGRVDERILVLYGDCPLIQPTTLVALLTSSAKSDASVGLITMKLADPTGYGRILRDELGRITAIREHKDASESERAIREVNPGVYAIDSAFLRTAIESLRTDNVQGEFYLTDLIAIAHASGINGVVAVTPIM